MKKVQKVQLTGQLGRIFDYMENGRPATGLELWRNCGVMSWAKKISLLNEILPSMGYVITKQRVKVFSKFAGREVSVMEYTLVRMPRKNTKPQNNTKRNKK